MFGVVKYFSLYSLDIILGTSAEFPSAEIVPLVPSAPPLLLWNILALLFGTE